MVKELTKRLVGQVEGTREAPSGCAGCTQHGQCIRVCPDRTASVLSASPDRLGSTLGGGPVGRELAAIIDHTLLKPEATLDEIKLLCAEAAYYGFKTVCVNAFWTSTCKKLLENYPVEVCTVVGFPLGATLADVKAYEAKRAVEEGANEIDMVMNIGALKGGMLDIVEEDIRLVVEAAKVPVKVILETCLLTDGEKVIACQLAKNAGAHFVKTSTGFSKGGATVEDVALMRKVVGSKMGVKASGGVRSLETAQKMIMAGANRIGASASVKIVRG
ncbi:MAG: deoxyribose-phosphate aldolase [Planctomycetota bacterium]|nr:MAG: deoxyribose-phosphate aldolase [Planctomycetota bacterium]